MGETTNDDVAVCHFRKLCDVNVYVMYVVSNRRLLFGRGIDTAAHLVVDLLDSCVCLR